MKCIVIEDELPAQKLLKKYIDMVPELELVGIFDNVILARNLVASQQVDIIFLDINLPVLNGISFLRTMSKMPSVIITTAYAEYAVEGFELGLTDYLVKPFSFERFYKAVQKAIPNTVQAQEPVQVGATNTQYPAILFVPVDKTLQKVEVNAICYLEAINNYLHIYFQDSKLLVSDTLKNWEQKLSPKEFVRIHKSYIVRISCIKCISGNIVVIDGIELPIGRTYKENLLNRL